MSSNDRHFCLKRGALVCQDCQESSLYIYIYQNYKSVRVKKPRLYNFQMLQTDIWKKSSMKKKKRQKNQVLFENKQAAGMSTQKKKHRQNYLS